jgi:hypothetical protein
MKRYRLLLFVSFALLAGAGRTYSQAQGEFLCPTMVVECPDANSGPTLKFTVNLPGAKPNVEATFNWTISAGKITSGQGTTAITVDTSGFEGQSFTATAELVRLAFSENGEQVRLPKECGNKASCSIIPGCPPPIARKFDEYGKETKPLMVDKPDVTLHRRTRRGMNKRKVSPQN